MTDILDNPFDPFADAVEETLRTFRNEITGLRGELTTALTEVRSLRAELETRSTPQVIEGPPGKDGAPGKDGVDGKDGKDGIDGKDGAPGERGADGLNGRDGKDGIDGRNGVDGIATREEIEEIVERRAALIQTRTLADYHQRTWIKDTEYKRGAVVAWNGATWLAMEDTKAVPGISPDWQLIAKQGRDGRDKR